MSRAFNGSTQYGTRAATYLANSAGPFTISLWFTPANLTDTVKAVLANATGAPWWQLRLDAGVVVFESNGYSGTNPGTGSGITWATTALKHVAWRYKGQGAEWSKWDAGAKSVINAAISFTLPNVGAQFDIARNWSGAHCAGTYAEVAIWNAALPDEYMAELAAGVAADQLLRPSLIAYFPLRGNSSPETNYAVAADTLTLGNAPAQAAHPTTVPPWQADVNASAWVLDLFHPSGTKRIGSTDLTEDVDVDILGAKYTSRLLNDPPISEGGPVDDGGILVVGQTTVEIDNRDGWLDRSWEWRQCPMRLREYDRATHALVTEMLGVVVDPGNMANDRMVLTCASADEALLAQPLPRQVIEVGTAGSALLDDTDLLDLRRSDVGRPIPLIFGRAIVVPPFLKEQVADPGGGDFILGWGTGMLVSNVWFDSDAATPGLEPGLVFATAPGSPTSATTTTFTVTGDQSKVYTVGAPVRRSGDAGATWDYSTVVGYSGGTVTLADAILPASPTAIGLVQVGGEFAVEDNRWKFVGINTTFLTTARFPIVPSSGVVAEINRATLSNPADVIQFLLEDPDQGLGETCNAASFAQAQVDFIAAGLGYAVNGSVGGDGSQREAFGAINELGALRGCELWKDEAGEWVIRVDTAPTIQTRTLEFGADLKNNVAEVLSVTRTPLAQAVGVLTLRYGAGGRAGGSKQGRNFFQQDYSYRASATVVGGVGTVRRTIESQFLNYERGGTGHQVPARVLYYRAKRAQRADQQIRFRMTRAGRRVRRGQVYPFVIPSAGIASATNFRILSRERTLNDFIFTAVGPYDADIFDTNISNILAAVSVPTEEALPEDAPAYRNPVNLLLNADFSTGLRKAGVPTSSDTTILPNWIVSLPAFGTLTALSVTRDSRAVGGHYLTIGVGTPSTGIALIAWSDPTDATSGYSVVGGALYLFSTYLDSTAAGGPTADWAMEVNWRDSAGTFLANTVLGQLRPVPGDISGFGHQRFYGIARAPAGAAWVAPYFRLTGSSVTYKLSAVQFEEQGNVFGRPGAWIRNAPHGIEPVNMRDGALTVRADGEVEAGIQVRADKGTTFDTGGVTLSGTSTVLGTAGPGLLTCVTARVTTLIAGPASWSLALDFGGGVLTTLATGLALAANTTVADADLQTGPIPLTAAVNIVAIPSSGSFSAGKVKVLAHVQKHIPPTS